MRKKRAYYNSKDVFEVTEKLIASDNLWGLAGPILPPALHGG